VAVDLEEAVSEAVAEVAEEEEDVVAEEDVDAAVSEVVDVETNGSQQQNSVDLSRAVS